MSSFILFVTFSLSIKFNFQNTDEAKIRLYLELTGGCEKYSNTITTHLPINNYNSFANKPTPSTTVSLLSPIKLLLELIREKKLAENRWYLLARETYRHSLI